MAGIGFQLQRLLNKGTVGSMLQAYSHAGLITSGPWILTIATLAFFFTISQHFISFYELSEFRVILLYNFSFSLVSTSPLAILSTRYLADSFFVKDWKVVPGLIFGNYVFILMVLFPLALFFYFEFSNLSFWVAVYSAVNFTLLCMVWTLHVFLTILKRFVAISSFFIGGMVLAIVLTVQLAEPFGISGMLVGFSIGLTLIISGIMALLFQQFSEPIKHPFRFIKYFFKYWEIVFGYTVYNIAIWIDKWMFWFSPEQSKTLSGLVTCPVYDGGMFIASLIMIPALSIFLVNMETSFFESYVGFYKSISDHASLRTIRDHQDQVLKSLKENGENLFLFQAAFTIAVLAWTPYLVNLGVIVPIQISIFRFGVLGASLQVFTLIFCVLLSYFELRRQVVIVQTVFLVGNVSLTLLTMQWGFEYYGMGYFLASVISFLTAGFIFEKHVRRLVYTAFITANPAIKKS